MRIYGFSAIIKFEIAGSSHVHVLSVHTARLYTKY